MKVEEEFHSWKKYQATAIPKIPYCYWSSEEIAELNNQEFVLQKYIEFHLSNIGLNYDFGKTTKIKQDVIDYNNSLENTKQQCQNSNPQQNDTSELQPIYISFWSVAFQSIIKLIKVVTFQNLSQQSIQIFKQKGVDLIKRIIKNGTIQYQSKIFILVANLAIDSVTMRDVFIQQGTVEVIIQALQQNQSKLSSIIRKTTFKLNAYSALIALIMGDPLPSRNKVEKAVDKVLTDIAYIYQYLKGSNKQITVGAMWVLYHYSDYRNEEKCKSILKLLLKLIPTFHTFVYKINLFESNFNKIFRQIYEYHIRKTNSQIIPILHGCCYKGSFSIQHGLQTIFRQYTPQMYMSLFREALKHKITTVKSEVISPWQYAIYLVSKEEEQEKMGLALEFISWVLNPLVELSMINSQDKCVCLPLHQRNIIENEIFNAIKLNLTFLNQLRHSNRRMLASQALKIILKYNEILKCIWKYS